MNQSFHITRVVTKNFFSDWWQGVRNLIGHNLIGYQKMIDEGLDECWKEVKEKGIKPKWYRVEMNQLTNGAMAIILYGETE